MRAYEFRLPKIHIVTTLTGFEFVLTRHWTKYIIYNYFPSCLFVGISWISFVVPIEAIPGRMALLVTLLLVQINIFNSSIYTQPNTEVITALSGKKKQRVFHHTNRDIWRIFRESTSSIFPQLSHSMLAPKRASCCKPLFKTKTILTKT